MTNKKCIVLFSGGLDSRLVVKLMQERGFEVVAVHFKLPFGCSCLHAKDFCKKNKVRLKIFDCTSGRLLQDYLEVIERAEHGTGVSVNPCIDCKIFMLKHTNEFAKSEGIKVIATGEVPGQRPMSQKENQLRLIKENSKIDKLIRPLLEIGFKGRQRVKQIELARKFGIDYPKPAGGCLLCEKLLKKRFEFLIKRGLNEKELPLVCIGRHFVIERCWIVLGRDENENKVLENSKIGKLIEPSFSGPSALILDNLKDKGLIEQLVYSYSKLGNLKERKLFEEFKI